MRIPARRARVITSDRPRVRSLMPHQSAALEYVRQNHIQHPAFFMAMRLGKTLTSIRWVQSLRPHARTVLVVGPVSVLGSWAKELELEGERYVLAHGLSSEKRDQAVDEVLDGTPPDGRRWLLLNYESLLYMGEMREYRGRRKRSCPLMAYAAWDAVIVDESTRLKNPKAQTSALMCEGFRNARHRAILTGFPAPEGPQDMFQQFKFLYGEFLGCRNYWDFRLRYFAQDWSGYNWHPIKGARALITQEMRRLAFVMTRAKAGMPDRKVYQTRTVPMNDGQRRLQNSVLAEYAYTAVTGETVETTLGITQRMWLHKIAGGFTPDNELIAPGMADDVMELLTGELCRESVVIWALFRHEVEYLRGRLTAADVPAVVITGATTAEQRTLSLQDFQNGRVRVLVATVDCAKFGVDCSVADTAIYYSNSLSCETRVQSEDRIIHPKKKRPVLILDMLYSDSAGEDVREIVREKALSGKAALVEFDARMVEKASRLSAQARRRAVQQRTGNKGGLG